MQLPGVHYNQDTNTAESRLFNWIIRDYGHGIIVQHASAPGGTSSCLSSWGVGGADPLTLLKIMHIEVFCFVLFPFSIHLHNDDHDDDDEGAKRLTSVRSL